MDFEAQSIPHRIAMYASQSPSPTLRNTRYRAARYDLTRPDFHRLELASLA
jgi:hypothetical protein